MDTASFWDKHAAGYAARPVKDEGAYAATLERVRAHLSAEDRVLELGCGTGTTALKLADAAAHITATDISGEMIAISREKAAAAGVVTVDFRMGGPGDGSLPAGPFDAVLAFNFLHLLENVPAAIAEIRGLVKPGGHFISKTPCLSGRYRVFWPLVAAMRLVGKAPYVNFFSPEKLEEAIRAAGFDILETGDYPKSPPSHLVVARRPA